ncbi:MAG: hypothetical protein AAF224_06425 [Pseudomonadota bacterium]
MSLQSPPASEKEPSRWRAFFARNDVKWVLRWCQRLTLAGVIIYLIYELSQVGWLEVAHNLPTAPLFYVFFILRFLALPLSEIPAYELVWKQPLWRYVTAFIRKRVYNFAVVGYSGEAFFTLWARRNLALSDKAVLTGIKDNNILSAFASNSATVVLVVIVAFNGALGPALEALPGAKVLFALAFLSSLALAVTVIFFHKKLLHVSAGMAARLTGIHGLRMVVVMALHAAMYAAALPGGAFTAWLVLIALQLVLSRIPFLPNLDLVFLSAALALSPVVGVSEAAVAGVLVAEAGLSQILNFGLFFATAHDAREGDGKAKEAAEGARNPIEPDQNAPSACSMHSGLNPSREAKSGVDE